LLIASIEHDNPVLFLEHKALYRLKVPVEEEKYTVPLRRAAIVRQGADIEPEKITNELEAPVSGVVSKILIAAGTEEYRSRQPAVPY